jgi:hypothetical protein
MLFVNVCAINGKLPVKVASCIVIMNKLKRKPNQALQRTRTASAPSSWTPTGSTALPASAEGKR